MLFQYINTNLQSNVTIKLGKTLTIHGIYQNQLSFVVN